MDLSNILVNVGGQLLKDVIPGSGAIADVVNQFLPDGIKVDPTTDTTNDVVSKINSIQDPAVKQKMIDYYTKQLDSNVSIVQSNNDVAKQDIISGDSADVNNLQTLALMDKNGDKSHSFIAVFFAVLLGILVFSIITVQLYEALFKGVSVNFDSMFCPLILLALPIYGWFGIRMRTVKNLLNSKNSSSDSNMSFGSRVDSIIGGVAGALGKSN